MPESQPVENFLANELQRQGHKYMVQRHIQCMSCQSILDVRTAVSFDIYDGNKQLQYAGILCGNCFDRLESSGTMDKAIAAAGEGGDVDTFDGRKRWK
tara:strand:+ start:84 stop:377 length:294 start_codon:yes stop_codon:yes gene_type:complete